MSEDKEKQYRIVGWAVSIATQVVMFFIFYFLVAWREPYPPIPSYGIELAFGMEEAGTGEEQLSGPGQSEIPGTGQPVEEKIPTDPSEGETELLGDAIPITDAVTGDSVIAESLAEIPDRLESAEISEPDSMDGKQINESFLTPLEENSKKGDSVGLVSKDKGKGDIDGRSIMGEQGSPEGASLKITGWIWDSKPRPDDDSNESGNIVFGIKVDDSGDVVGVKTISSTVSFAVVKKYEQAVFRLTFSQTTDAPPAPVSEGIITFIIRSR